MSNARPAVAQQRALLLRNRRAKLIHACYDVTLASKDSSTMLCDDASWRAWDPWRSIPTEYNLGVDLTAGQVRRGLGTRPALLWENAAHDCRTLTYGELDVLSNRLASSLRRIGVRMG